MDNKKMVKYIVTVILVIALVVVPVINNQITKVKNEENKKVEEQRQADEKAKKEKEEFEYVTQLLDSDTKFADMKEEDRNKIGQFIEINWNNHDEEIRTKFSDRKEEYHNYYNQRKKEFEERTEQERIERENKERLELEEANKKPNLKKKVESILAEYNVTSVDILTHIETKELMISVQMQSSFSKDTSSKEEINNFCNKINGMINDLSNYIDIQLIDKNHQLIAIYSYGEIKYY